MEAKVGVCERISLELTDDLRFVPKQYLPSWTEGGFIVRQFARDVWQYVQDTVADSSRVGAYLGGPMGVGKSSIMYYVVHKAKEEGWLVIYIPRCDEWLQKGYPNNTGWYSYFFDAVLAGLKNVDSEKVSKSFEFCIPPEKYTSWEEARILKHISLDHFQELFSLLVLRILNETDVPVLLAFDESQALFENGINVRVDAPFSLIDWSSYFKRGCVFVTATADSPYRRSLRSGHERYILNAGCLLDDEFASWIETGQFEKILNHPDYNQDFLPEIRSSTGDIPRELVLLSEEHCNHTKSLNKVLENYSNSRQAAYEGRFEEFVARYPDNLSKSLKALVKFFVQVNVREQDVSIKFLDTGLAYISDSSVVPLNSNALKCFKLLVNSDEKAMNDLKSDIAGKVGYICL